eukprot:19576-Heterococcus_DN1.PRE.3
MLSSLTWVFSDRAYSIAHVQQLSAGNDAVAPYVDYRHSIKACQLVRSSRRHVQAAGPTHEPVFDFCVPC